MLGILTNCCTSCRLGLDVMECGATDAGVYAVIATDDKGRDSKASFSLNVNI